MFVNRMVRRRDISVTAFNEIDTTDVIPMSLIER